MMGVAGDAGVPSSVLLRLGLAQIGCLILASADELGALAGLLGAARLLDHILGCQEAAMRRLL